MIFTTYVEMEREDGYVGKNAVPINDRPFVMEMVTHQVASPVDFPEGFAVGNQGYLEFQHGLYTIDWSLYNQDRYWQGDPPMADAAFGSVRNGIWIPLRAPIALEKNKTINVSVGNVGLKRADYKLQIQFHGVEDYRKRDQAGNLVDPEGS
jgi:hypothetical protein